MEFVGQARTSEACSLLDVPGLSSLDADDDEGEVVVGIRPKSSPLPRRKTSVSDDDDSELEPPLCSSRRVSFADAKGLSLVQVKEFETWDEPKLPVFDLCEREGKCTDKYFLSLHTFSLPSSTEELLCKVQDQKVELETIELLPGTSILKGVIRVLNISFSKAVYVRTTLDGWCSHFDLLAEYVPGSSDGLMDSFTFKLTLVPPFSEQGARVDFCLRYETPVGTFWANNNNRNYVLLCHHGMKDRQEKPQRENVNKKSCLKPVSQNLGEENISAVEASPQENISTAVSTQEEEKNTVKNKQMNDHQTETSEERKLQAENEQNSRGRSRRRATRTARLKDHFAQRDGDADDAGRDESKQVAKDENPVEAHTGSQWFSESEGFHFVSATMNKCAEALVDVLSDTLQTHNYTSNSEPEKSESSGLGDSESATEIPDIPLHSHEEAASAERQNLSRSVSRADGRNLKRGTSDGDSSQSFVSQATSFTFTTVVAPLYCQAFGRVGSEHRSVDDGDLTQSYYHTDIRENSGTVKINIRGDNDSVQKNETKESKQEHSDAVEEEEEEEEDEKVEEKEEEEETNLNMMGITTVDQRVSLQDPVEIPHSDLSYAHKFQPKSVSGNTEAHSHIENLLDTDLGNSPLPKESLNPCEEAQADNLTFDLRSQAVAETPHARQTEHESLQINMNSDKTPPQHQTRDVTAGVATNETDQHTSNDAGRTETISTTSVISEADQPQDASHDFNSRPTDDLVTGENASGFFCCEIIIKTSRETQEETEDVQQPNKLKNEEETNQTEKEDGDELSESKTNADQQCGDTELKNEQSNVSDKEEHCEIKAAALREEDFSFLEHDKVKKCTEAEGGRGGELGDTGIETASENRDTTKRGKEKRDDARGEDITDPGEKENTSQDADVLEVKHRIGEEKTVAGNNRDAEKTFECAESSQMETIAGEDKPGAEEIEEQEEKGEHFTWMKEVRGEKIGPNAGVLWEDQEENRNEEKWNCQETVDADSEGATSGGTEDEVGCLEERRDITRNVPEDGLSAQVSNVQVRGNDSTGAGQHIPKEGERDFGSNERVTPDRSQAAVEESLPVLTDEPESDQTSAESDSDDDEVELYMNCLRAVHAGTRANKDRSNDAASAVARRSKKHLPAPMPPISESLDEEPHLSRLQGNNEDAQGADVQPTCTTLSGGQDHIARNVARWKKKISCSNISKTLLYATLLVVFLVVAYHYDFLACFGLYLVSVVWLCCQEETQPVKNNKRIG